MRRAPRHLVWLAALAPWASASAEEAAGPSQSYETVVRGRTGSRRVSQDGELKLSGKELAERGAHDLADALDLLPEVRVRPAGRGGFQVDLRGGRKGMVTVLVDGVPIDEPYYGNFDLTSIPVTDILEIRVSLAPASPLDGAGGPGGVVEVVTRSANGARRIQARSSAASSGTLTAAATARSALAGSWSLRASATGARNARAIELIDPAGGSTSEVTTVGSNGNAAVRLEYLSSRSRVVADLWGSRKQSENPPGTDQGGTLLAIDPELSARASLAAETGLGGYRVGARVYGHIVSRVSDSYVDAERSMLSSSEDLLAGRVGAAAYADRPLGGKSRLAMRLTFDGDFASTDNTNSAGTVTTEGAGGVGEAAVGVRLVRGRFRLSADLGLALPAAGGAEPWPEGKLVGSVTPIDALELRATAAYKGRVPTLRERYSPQIGDSSLAPEKTAYGELAVTARPTADLRAALTGFVRDTEGLISFRSEKMALANVGDVQVRGIEAALELAPARTVGGGAAYSYADHGPRATAIDFFPAHRAEGWLSVRRRRAGGTARVRYLGAVTDRETTLEGHTTLDASAWARVTPRVTATLRLENLADARFHERSMVYAPGRVIAFSVEGTWD